MKKHAVIALSCLLGFASSAFANNAPATEIQPQTVVTQTTSVAPAATTVANTNSVNINTASAPEIQDKLVGIGAKKAQAIVDYRTKNGNFASVEQLTEVSGIGKATLEKNRDRIVLQ